MASKPAEPLLTVSGLTVEFGPAERRLRAVDGVSFSVDARATLGIVGESGSGKSMTVMALLGLLPEIPGLDVTGDVRFEGRDLLGMTARERRKILGQGIGVIFQDPLTALNPVLKIGLQITEVIRAHQEVSEDKATQRAVELLQLVGIHRAETRLGQYPHELSGGMRQRVMIAIAIANRPKLLVADEPTTALDVTIQAQILEILADARAELGAAAILITHDLGVIAEQADDVIVMYAGRVIESCPVDGIFNDPKHPATSALLGSLPRLDRRRGRLPTIAGRPPELAAIPSGCAFHPRCSIRADRAVCVERVPALHAVGLGHLAACHFSDEVTLPDLERPVVVRGRR